MKKINLKAIDQNSKTFLTREELKMLVGGVEDGGSDGGDIGTVTNAQCTGISNEAWYYPGGKSYAGCHRDIYRICASHHGMCW